MEDILIQSFLKTEVTLPGFTRKQLKDEIWRFTFNPDAVAYSFLLRNPKLSDFFGNLNNLLTLQDNLRNSLQNLKILKIELVEQKEELSLERADAAALKS